MIGTLMQIGRAISVATTVIEATKEKPLSGDPQANLTPTREPQPLTDAQIDAIFYENHTVKDHPWINWRRFARAVLAARKELK